MQHERRKEIAEFVGIVAILASLLFLGFEIQQSNRIAIASTEIADVMNIWQTIETACINGIAQKETCGELDDDIRAFVATFPGLRKQWGFFLENYPSLAHMHMFTVLRQALEEES